MKDEHPLDIITGNDIDRPMIPLAWVGNGPRLHKLPDGDFVFGWLISETVEP